MAAPNRVLPHQAPNRALNQAQCQAAPHQHQTGQCCTGHCAGQCCAGHHTGHCHTGQCTEHHGTGHHTGHHHGRHCARLHCTRRNHTGQNHRTALGAAPQRASPWAPLHQPPHCRPTLHHRPTASPYTNTQHPTPLLPPCTPPPIPPQHPTLPPSVTLCQVPTLHPAPRCPSHLLSVPADPCEDARVPLRTPTPQLCPLSTREGLLLHLPSAATPRARPKGASATHCPWLTGCSSDRSAVPGLPGRAQQYPTALNAFGSLGRGLTRGAGGFAQLYPSGPRSTAGPAVPPKCPRRQEGAVAVVQLQKDCRLALFP